MRNTSRFLWIISFVIPLQAFACKCEYQTWFDLLTYDQHTYVMEIEVLGRIEEPAQTLQVPPVEPPMGQENLPPPFLPPFDYEDFNIRVLTNFKGDDTSIQRLRATNKSTSCYGAPQVGQRYLVYADGLATPEGFSALVIVLLVGRPLG